jgi:hypothetical protein
VKGSFIPVLETTRALTTLIGKQSAKNKNYDHIGIERVVKIAKEEETKQTNWIQTIKPQETFSTQCARLSSGTNVYARVNLVELHWGLIPVEYEVDGKKKHLIFQVLRIVPQPGLHLMKLIRTNFFERLNDPKLKDKTPMISEVCHYLEQIVNHEADINYGMEGVWDNSKPGPWKVTDPNNATSVERLLSPFTVLRRMLQHLKGGYCGTVKICEPSFDQETLVIDGFPDLKTASSAQAAIQMYEEHQIEYLNALCKFNVDFGLNLAIYLQESDKEFVMPPILTKGWETFNLLETKLNMVFDLRNYLKFSKENLFHDSERIGMPKLGIAAIDYFIFFQLSEHSANMSFERFIEAHVGDHLASEVVTETKIALKYRVTDVQSLEDFPKAGQHKSARDGYKRNIASLVKNKDRVTAEVVQFYNDYLLLQINATMNGLVLDTWMSDRVYRSAVIMEQLMGNSDPMQGLRDALEWVEKSCTMECSRNTELFRLDSNSYSWARINSCLLLLNRSLKANAQNLSIIWGMVKSDVLTFLGLHNQTWTWLMFCMLLAPMYGHLRCLTEDGHAARSECILTAKPNSVGLNEVVVKAVNYCFEELFAYLVPLTDSDRRVLRLDKVDRTTRAGMENQGGVGLVEGRVVSKPSSNLMQATLVDEGLRTFDQNALDGLVSSGLPRDSNAGEGSTCKSVVPERGHIQKGETKQLPGMGWYILCFATNSNARNPAIAESLRTLATGAMIAYAPGAPQTQGLNFALSTRNKRKRGQTLLNSSSSGECMLPSDADECKHIAHIMSVAFMLSRHIGLINKTAQSDWEISYPVQQYMDSFKDFFLRLFADWVPPALGPSCDRLFKGQIARSIAACHMCTTVSVMEAQHDVKTVCLENILNMENSALTLNWANMTLLNGISHLSDGGLCIVNQLIRWKLNVPVLSMEYLEQVFEETSVISDEFSSDHNALKKFMQRLADARKTDNDDVIKHYTGGYVQVPGIGSHANYNQTENYLFKYCGINLSSHFSYLKMFKDSAHKCLDLSMVLDLSTSMLKMDTLMDKTGVKIHKDSSWLTPPGGNHEKGTNYLILIPDANDTKQSETVGTVWVHVPQLLVVTSLIGKVELHADNPMALGRGLFQLIARRFMPQQALPLKHLLCETFSYSFGEVTQQILPVKSKRDYFFRNRTCYSAWREGIIKDLNCMIGAHPLEDVIHIHGWIQLHYMHVGKSPKTFYYMPGKVPRVAEVMAGCNYPLIDENNEPAGVLQVCPDNSDVVWIGDEETRPEAWQSRIIELKLQVGPLIRRKNAVFTSDDNEYLCLEPYGINEEGEYTTTHGATFSWKFVHERLLALGTHVFVNATCLQNVPTESHTHVLGWLRYPDECDSGYGENGIFIAFRISENGVDFDDVCILKINACDCSWESDNYIDYLHPQL